MPSVEEVVSPFLRQARPTGSDGIRATCPLCNHPRTFLVSASRGTFICFSCHERGGLSKLFLLMGMSRGEIDRRLEGVYFERKKKFSFSENKNVLPEYVLGAFEVTPKPLIRAGFSEEILKSHDVGFDRRRMRITFPIRDHLGRLTAISGRAFPAGSPRYLVYQRAFEEVVPGYVPTNRDHLYGMDTVYPKKYHNPQDDAPIILVEGYKGCLWMRQLGYETTVALQGYSLTPAQEMILRRLRGPKYVFLDNEEGKAKAGPKGFSALGIASRLMRSSPVRICTYPKHMEDGKSPDDLQKHEAEQILKQAKTVSQVKIGLYNGL